MLPTLLTLFACSTSADTGTAAVTTTDTGATDSAETGATDTGATDSGATDSGTACDTADTAASTALPACGGGVYPCELAYEHVEADRVRHGTGSSTGVSNCTPTVWSAQSADDLAHLAAIITTYAGPSDRVLLQDVPVDWTTKRALVTAIRCFSGTQVGFDVRRIVARSRTSIEIQYVAVESTFADSGQNAGWDVYTFDKVEGLGSAHAQADMTLTIPE